MRRPLDSYRVTGDTEEHAAYNPPVGPATDYAAPDGPLPIGTPIKAPFDLERVERWGTDDMLGGYAINAFSLDGRFKFVGQHLDRYQTNPGLREGDIIAYSGNSGALTTGPHLHCYVIVLATGLRMSMEEFMRAYGQTPAHTTTNQGSTEEYPDMFIAIVKGSFYLIVPQGSQKPTAVVLGKDSGARTSGLPVLTFTGAMEINDLKAAVTGIN